MDIISAKGISIRFHPDCGILDALTIDAGDGTVLHPLHRAPWADGGEALPDSVMPIERALAGDFLCAPFSFSAPDVPIHGWAANGHWESDGPATETDGGTRAQYRLRQDISGASVSKTVTLVDDHPFVYQRHVFSGGSGHLPVAHHAMIRVPGGARLSFSPKSFGRTPETALETDPSRGVSALAYPQRFDSLSAVQLADGRIVDATTYPFVAGHEDLSVLAERPGQTIGWSAALAARDGFLFFAIKDARCLPETILWMSNGGRSYAPWLSRHTAVIGIEEAATGLHATGAVIEGADDGLDGRATGLTLLEEGSVDIRYGFGAIKPPATWSAVADIRLDKDTLTLVDVGGDSITLPFLSEHFAEGA